MIAEKISRLRLRAACSALLGGLMLIALQARAEAACPVNVDAPPSSAAGSMNWLFVATPDTLPDAGAKAAFLAFVESYRPGGVVVLRHQIKHLRSKALLQSFFGDIKRRGGSLIALDQEGGQIQALTSQQGFFSIPSPRRLGLVNDPDLTFQLAYYVGRELKSYGVDWNLAPVADLAYAGNPVITKLDRGFSDDPHIASTHTKAFAMGLQQAGVIATLKHFPGHGATINDSHKRKVVIKRGEQDLYAKDLVPFKDSLPFAQSVMSAHVNYPAICPGQPASLSSCIIEKHLRRRLKYGGVVITDAFGMDAIKKHYTQDHAVIQSLRSGHDMVLVDYDQVMPVIQSVCRLAAVDSSFAQILSQASVRVDRLRRLHDTKPRPLAKPLMPLHLLLQKLKSPTTLAH